MIRYYHGPYVYSVSNPRHGFPLLDSGDIRPSNTLKGTVGYLYRPHNSAVWYRAEDRDDLRDIYRNEGYCFDCSTPESSVSWIAADGGCEHREPTIEDFYTAP